MNPSWANKSLKGFLWWRLNAMFDTYVDGTVQQVSSRAEKSTVNDETHTNSINFSSGMGSGSQIIWSGHKLVTLKHAGDWQVAGAYLRYSINNSGKNFNVEGNFKHSLEPTQCGHNSSDYVNDNCWLYHRRDNERKKAALHHREVYWIMFKLAENCKKRLPWRAILQTHIKSRWNR